MAIDVGFKGPGIPPVQSRHATEMTREEYDLRNQIIAAGRKTFIEVGTALAEIRERRGYRFEYHTFEEYCEKKWGWTASRSRQLISAAEFAVDIKSVTAVTLESERQARAAKQIGIEAIKQAAAEPIAVPIDEEWNEREEPKGHIEPVGEIAPRAPSVARALVQRAQQIKEALKSERPEKSRVNWSQHARSASNDEAQIIKWVMGLYNGGAAFDLDPTYSEGKLWDGLPKPLRKGDIQPVVEGCEQMDARHLPCPDASLSSIFFDPPFVVAPRPRPGIIRDRFSCYRTIEELWKMYIESVAEFYRVLGPDGLVVFKCMDMISGSKFHASHVEIINQARELGFYLEQIFILYREGPLLMSPNMENQQHARHNHCYYVVLRKDSTARE